MLPDLNGSVVSVEVVPGSMVSAGDVVVVLTAMKMETAVLSPHSGRVTEIFVKAGDLVRQGATVLVVVESTDAGADESGSGHAAGKGAAVAEQLGWGAEVEQLAERRARALEMGGTEGVAKQHAKGRLTLRERIACMLDSGSFREMG